jgi:uncharacterized protein
VTDVLRVSWPDAAPFVARAGSPIRMLAVSDEEDPALHSAASREAIGLIDFVIGAGDLEPDYLGFLADAFGAPLVYVRGNHDVGDSWSASQGQHLPDPLTDGRLHSEAGVRILPFSGAPRYAPHGRPRVEQQVSELGMWRRVLRAWPGAAAHQPMIALTHAAPRGLNDASDVAHRGFAAFRWLLDRVSPPLWLHGHTALVRRGIDARTVRRGDTLLVNVTGATLIELTAPSASE